MEKITRVMELTCIDVRRVNRGERGKDERKKMEKKGRKEKRTQIMTVTTYEFI